MTMVRAMTAAASLAAIALTAGPALAHTVAGSGDGFMSGILHPILGPDHLVAMVAVGLWGAQLGMPMLIALPIAFPVMMALGALAAIAGESLFGIAHVLEIGIALSALVLGLVVAFAYRAPAALAVVVVGLFAVFHGYAHGLELPNAAAPLPYGLGFVISTGALHALGIAIGALNLWSGVGPAVVRVSGAVIAVSGVYFLSGALGLNLA